MIQMLVIFLISLPLLAVENGMPLAPQWNGVSPVVRISSPDRTADVSDCSGVILTPRVILTAAHCLHNMQRIRRISVEHTESKARHTSFFKFMVKSGYGDWFHDKPKQDFTGFDIGVLILRNPVTFQFPKVTLATQSLNWNSFVPNVWLLGYGDQRPFYKSASSLPISDLKILNFPDKPEFIQFRSSKPGAGVCEGDSGGGVFAWSDNQWTLIGIQSTKTEGKCRDESNRGFFVPVYSNLDWIEAAIKSSN